MIDMQIRPTAGCCGLYELYELNDGSPSTLKDFVDVFNTHHANHGELAFVLFTDNLDSYRGTRLVKYITDKGLGIITASEAITNPKSSRVIQCWIWAIDWEALRAWRATRG